MNWIDTLLGIKNKTDLIPVDITTQLDINIPAIQVLVDSKVAWKLQGAATTIDLNQAAATYDLLTGTAQVVMLESLVIRMSGGALAAPFTYFTIQTNDATPQIIIDNVASAVANLTNEAQISWNEALNGPIYIKVGKKIQLTIPVGFGGAARVCDVVVKYRAVVSGGYLA